MKKHLLPLCFLLLVMSGFTSDIGKETQDPVQLNLPSGFQATLFSCLNSAETSTWQHIRTVMFT